MEYYILLDHWAYLVRDFKDSEREFGISAYDSERLARAILNHLRYTRIRQYNLFMQKRGEDYEKMLEKLGSEFSLEAIQRFVETEELWTTTLEMGEQ